MCTLDRQQGCDGNVLMQQIYRIWQCSKGHWAAWHRDPATIKSQPRPGLEKCWCKEKNKTVDATGNEQGAPALHPNPHSLSFILSLSLSLSYLRLQASRPLQQRPWSTTPPAWSSHIPPDYSIERAAKCHEPGRGSGGKKTERDAQQEWWRSSTGNVLNIWRRASSHLSPSFSLSRSVLSPFAAPAAIAELPYQSDEKWIIT